MRHLLSSAGLSKEEKLEAHGLTRRDFMKFCATVAAAMGMPGCAQKVADTLSAPAAKRPPVVWLAMAECTGCAEAILRSTEPFIDVLVLDTLNLTYHETIMQASGHAAEEALYDTVNKNKGQFIVVVDGSIPTRDNGRYGMIGGRPMADIVKEIVPQAKAAISIGTCASFGGIPVAKPNPSQAKSLQEVTGVKTINIPGCPPNPINFVGTVVHLLQKDTLPELDANGRPLMFFGETVHDNCPRLPHYNNGEFAKSFDSEEAKKGWCLFELGCKGPLTYNNCPKVLFNSTSWPVQAGHPCIGCSEPDFWDAMTPFYEPMG